MTITAAHHRDGPGRAAGSLRAARGSVRPAAAWPLLAAGAAFIAYPVLRPAGPDTGLAGAESLSSTAWLLAHCLGMAGFVLLAFGLRGLAATQPSSWRGRPVRGVETQAWLAVALLLPYYGAEAYGLRAAGRFTLESGEVAALDAMLGFRLAPLEATTFALGLLLLGLVGARLLIGWWRAGGLLRLGAALAGAGLLTYLPQFFTPASVRIGHGVVLGGGLLLLGLALARGRTTAAPGARR